MLDRVPRRETPRRYLWQIMMHDHYAFGVVAISALAKLAASHPLCYYSEKPTDLDIVMEFCPNQVDGACCNELEEDAAEFLFNTVSSSPLTGECAELYKQVRHDTPRTWTHFSSTRQRRRYAVMRSIRVLVWRVNIRATRSP